MHLFPIKITLLQYLTMIKNHVTVNANKLFTNYKLFLLMGKLHRMPLHTCSQAWNSALYPGEKHQAKVALFWIWDTVKMKSGFWKSFHFPWPLILSFSKIQFPLLWCHLGNLKRLNLLEGPESPPDANFLWRVCLQNPSFVHGCWQ